MVSGPMEDRDREKCLCHTRTSLSRRQTCSSRAYLSESGVKELTIAIVTVMKSRRMLQRL